MQHAEPSQKSIKARVSKESINQTLTQNVISKMPSQVYGSKTHIEEEVRRSPTLT